MKRPPRPGELIWVLRPQPSWWKKSAVVERCRIRKHSGAWIAYERRGEATDIHPGWYHLREMRVSRFDEGVTWLRGDVDDASCRAACAAIVMA